MACNVYPLGISNVKSANNDSGTGDWPLPNKITDNGNAVTEATITVLPKPDNPTPTPNPDNPTPAPKPDNPVPTPNPDNPTPAPKPGNPVPAPKQGNPTSATISGKSTTTHKGTKKKVVLPQTGEKDSSLLSALGSIILSMLLFLGLKRRN